MRYARKSCTKHNFHSWILRFFFGLGNKVTKLENCSFFRIQFLMSSVRWNHGAPSFLALEIYTGYHWVRFSLVLKLHFQKSCSDKMEVCSSQFITTQIQMNQPNIGTETGTISNFVWSFEKDSFRVLWSWRKLYDTTCIMISIKWRAFETQTLSGVWQKAVHTRFVNASDKYRLPVAGIR